MRLPPDTYLLLQAFCSTLLRPATSVCGHTCPLYARDFPSGSRAAGGFRQRKVSKRIVACANSGLAIERPEQGPNLAYE